MNLQEIAKSDPKVFMQWIWNKDIMNFSDMHGNGASGMSQLDPRGICAFENVKNRRPDCDYDRIIVSP